jgi:hypothetical protein
MRSTAELATGRLAELIEELGVLGEWPVNPYIMGPSRDTGWYFMFAGLGLLDFRARRQALRQELQALEGAESVEQHG